MKTLYGFKAIFKGNRSGREIFKIINAENKKQARELVKNITSNFYTFYRLETIDGVVFGKKAYIAG